MLVLILLLHNVAGKDTQKDVPIIHTITSCPDIGYYFKRNESPNAIDPGPCQLCFCQDNTTAVCWLRESKRCDPREHTFAEKIKRDNRSRRSPAFADIFFRDAAREVFDRQTPQQCKPFESSISEGCPPADWCIGCTVCDCDANGRWDCHNLSFCPDKKGKKQVKKKKHYKINKLVKRQLPKKKITSKTTNKPNKKVEKISKKKPLIKKKHQIKKKKTKQNKKKGNQKRNTKKILKVNKSNKPLQKKKVPPKINKSKINRSNKKIIKGKKPITIESNKGQTKIGSIMDQNETVQFTKNLLKKVMDSVDKIVTESKNKFIQQKSIMTKNLNNKNKKAKSWGVKKLKNWQTMTYSPSMQDLEGSRRKRQITKDRGDHFEKENITNFLPKIEDIVFSPSIKYNNETVKNDLFISNTSNKNNYFKYIVDSKYDTHTKEKNKSETQYNNSQMSLKSNDLETINEKKVTYTNSTVFEPGHNGNRSSPLIIDISYLVRASLSNNSFNNTSNKKNKRCGQICQLKKTFKTLIGGIGRRNFRKKKDNTTNKNILSYFRNVYGRFFQTNKKSNASVIKKPVFRKRNIIKTLCKNINPCNVDPLDKTLQSKLYQLKIESNQILKSVKIIKGLLKLFGDREISVIKNNSSTDDNQPNKDILLLNAIVKDRHDLASTFKNLTETQLTQIDYIRDNTKMFILSIENFALLLNDIMKLLRSDNKQKISRRMLRCTKKYQNESIKNSIVGDKIQKFKNLLITYNLVQNRFMKGMFNVLSSLDQKTKPDNRKLAKVSDEIAKYNETRFIDNYTKNIINNLRKLNILAEKLSFKNRIKRAAIEDEAIDYFLILIEYLLKQNRLLDDPPVSDGIDLLIEAIKNSPDIKPFPKILFKQTSKPQEIKTDMFTTESLLVPSYSYHSEDKINENKNTLKANEVIKVFESIDEEPHAINMYDYDTEKNLQKSDSENENKFSGVKSTTSKIDFMTPIPKVYIANDNNEVINDILGPYDMEKNKDKKGYEVFVDETEDDEVILSTSSQSFDVHTEIPVTESFRSRTKFPSITIENYSKDSLNSLKGFKKTNLEWVDEITSHEENRRDVVDIKETTTEIKIQRATRTFKRAVMRYSNPASTISREIDDERPGKTMNPEYIMHKKQMNLLNSLDYGTEKSFQDSESKEKYNSESFPFM